MRFILEDGVGRCEGDIGEQRISEWIAGSLSAAISGTATSQSFRICGIGGCFARAVPRRRMRETPFGSGTKPT